MSASLTHRDARRAGAAALLIGLLTYALSETVLPSELPAVTLSLVAGLAMGAVLPYDTTGASVLIKWTLPVAIVLIGLRVSFAQVRELGLGTLALVVAGLAVGLTVALTAARLAGVPRRLGTLLALGTAICGNTAIISGAPIIRARREEIAYAVATITAFGTAAVLLFPPLGHALGLDDTQFGIWAGVGVNDTSQVVATGLAYSDAAGETATIVKLVRNAFLGLILVCLAILSPDARETGARTRPGVGLGIPWFVWGFVAATAISSLDVLPRWVVQASERVSTALVLVVMAAVGLSTRLGALRTVGIRPLLVGLAAMAALSSVALLAVLAGVGS